MSSRRGLPSDWKEIQLGKVAILSGRIGWRGLTAKEYAKQGPLFLSVHSLNYGDYVDFRDAFHISQERYDESPEIMLRPGDVLICKDGAGIGKLGIIGELPSEATINSSLLLVRAQSEISPKYLYYALSSPYFQDIVKSRLMGATTPHLYQRDITGFPIYLPPLPEQHRIVAVLDEAFAGLRIATANAEKNLKNAKDLFESYLNVAVSADRQGWQKRRLEEVVDERCSLSYGIVQPGNEQPGGLPIVRPVDLTEKLVPVEGLKRIDPSLAEAYGRTRLDGGELLLCVRGTTGAVSIAADDLSGANVTRGIVPIRFDASKVTQRFGYYALLSEPLQRQVREKTYGTALMQINIRDLRNLLIPIPALVEQESIGRRLDVLSQEALRLQGIYQSRLMQLRTLKQAILQRAFSGRLTSPHSQAIKEAAA